MFDFFFVLAFLFGSVHRLLGDWERSVLSRLWTMRKVPQVPSVTGGRVLRTYAGLWIKIEVTGSNPGL